MHQLQKQRLQLAVDKCDRCSTQTGGGALSCRYLSFWITKNFLFIILDLVRNPVLVKLWRRLFRTGSEDTESSCSFESETFLHSGLIFSAVYQNNPFPAPWFRPSLTDMYLLYLLLSFRNERKLLFIQVFQVRISTCGVWKTMGGSGGS